LVDLPYQKPGDYLSAISASRLTFPELAASKKLARESLPVGPPLWRSRGHFIRAVANCNDDFLMGGIIWEQNLQMSIIILLSSENLDCIQNHDVKFSPDHEKAGASFRPRNRITSTPLEFLFRSMQNRNLHFMTRVNDPALFHFAPEF
jgi:hypothetical protein